MIFLRENNDYAPRDEQRCLQNETGDEFWKSREIKNAFIQSYVLYYHQYIHENCVFLSI